MSKTWKLFFYFRWPRRPELSLTGCRTSRLSSVQISTVESWWSPTPLTWHGTGPLVSTHPLPMRASSAGWPQHTQAPIRLILLFLSLPEYPAQLMGCFCRCELWIRTVRKPWNLIQWDILLLLSNAPHHIFNLLLSSMLCSNVGMDNKDQFSPPPFNQVMSNPDRRPCHNTDFLRYNNIINGADWHTVPGSKNVCCSKR